MTLIPNNKNVVEYLDGKGYVRTFNAGPNAPVFNYDYIAVTYPVNTTEVYTYRLGGAGGTIQATLTVVYTSSSKNDLSTVTWT